MNKISNMEIYRHKAIKYYKKYLNYKKNKKGGGIDKPAWLDDYLKEVNAVYDSDYIITGSGAVSIYLNYFNNLTNGKFNELIPNLRIPNDVDFLYYCKGADYLSRRKINNYQRIQDTPQRSITFEFNALGAFPLFIKTFDVTCLSKISYVQIDDFKLLTLDKLLDFYAQELDDNESFLRNFKQSVLDIETKIENSIKTKHITEFLVLEEEHNDLIANLEKANNKILTLELKINIINTLIKNINIDSDLGSKYEIKIIPEATTPQKEFTPATTPDTTKSKDTTSGIFSSDIIKRLFGSDETPDTTEKDETPKTPDVSKKLSFDLKTPKSSSERTPFIPETPKTVSKKLDFGSDTSSKVEYVSYDIKFNFE